MILVIDNYDSFTYNLLDYLGRLGVECRVLRNDVPLSEITNQAYTGVLLSPGPGSPRNAGNLMQIIEYYEPQCSILGVCLGHQALGEYYGASLGKAFKPMHGKISEISVKTSSGLFEGLPERFSVVRYHSLILRSLPDMLHITAQTLSQEIMAMQHHTLPIFGVQFHPEAFLSEYGLDILQNWLRYCST